MKRLHSALINGLLLATLLLAPVGLVAASSATKSGESIEMSTAGWRHGGWGGGWGWRGGWGGWRGGWGGWRGGWGGYYPSYYSYYPYYRSYYPYYSGYYYGCSSCGGWW